MGSSLMSNANHKTGGYKNPPLHTRWKKGQSGNPQGKRRGRKNYRTELFDELADKVTVTENGRRRSLTKQTLIIKRMVADAVKGDARARDQLWRFMSLFDTADDDSKAVAPTSAEDADILARFRARLTEEIKAEEARQTSNRNDE